MFEHPIEKAVKAAIKALPYGTIPSSSYVTRGHVWAPQDAVFVEAEVVYSSGNKVVFTPRDEGDLADFILSGPEGETLDQGSLASGVDISVAVIGFYMIPV